jgi:large subunit ribosomal protein L30
MTTAKTIEVTLKRSPIGGTERQRETVKGLGLRRIGQRRQLPATPAVLGMVRKVCHLVAVSEAKD